ncbi:MAG: SPFH domain-containing protein, partial [Candidatus Nitrosopolaris sp.]
MTGIIPGLPVPRPENLVAKFNAEELITKRATAKAEIAETIANTLSARNIVVETVFITDFAFSQAFANQIESKVVAFQ